MSGADSGFLEGGLRVMAMLLFICIAIIHINTNFQWLWNNLIFYSPHNIM